MKKKIFLLAVSCIFGMSALFATGLGIQGGTDVANSGTNSIDVTFKLNKSPLIFAVGIPSFDPLSIGVTGDYWLVNDNLAGPVNYFVGIGGFTSIYIDDDTFGLTVGPRLPIGLNTFFAKNVLELYIQMAPGFAITINNGITNNFVCPLNCGLRAWF